jgi:GNAT superfamily N-acetyltransferase
MNRTIRVQSFYGKEIEKYILDLARLRMTVFRDFPYLYEGNLEYEKKYLDIYTKTPESVVVVAFDNDLIIGAASAMPLSQEADYVQEPFLKNNLDIKTIYYFAESVLLKEYRGLRLGHAFFDGREAAALKFGFNDVYFCGVNRPSDHPLRPNDFRPLDEFWNKRGYKKCDHLKSIFMWPDLCEVKDSPKEMIYWNKKL